VLELPEKRYEDVWVEIEGRQKEMYEKLKNELILEIKNMDGQQVIDESSNILKKLLRLTQIASNPNLIDENYKEDPAKFKILDEIVKGIIDKNEKVIIWTSFVDNIRKLRRRYSKYGALMLFGELPIEQRKTIVEKFKNDDDLKVLIANPSVAKEGLTLTSANNVVYVDRTFILADYLQSQDRIHRITQSRPCNIIKILAKDTIDEYIDEILYKKHIIAQFIQGDISIIKDEKEYLDREGLLRILG
jgi:SNF2 family DNA or RNA helicase